MESKSTTVEQGEPQEPDLSARGMRFLTGGLTSEGDTFLIGAAAVLLMGLLYPVAGPWSLLAFVLVPALAIFVRRALQRGETSRQ
jgi:hypothetical protein